jgi:hypothetical protein
MFSTSEKKKKSEINCKERCGHGERRCHEKDKKI